MAKAKRTGSAGAFPKQNTLSLCIWGFAHRQLNGTDPAMQAALDHLTISQTHATNFPMFFPEKQQGATSPNAYHSCWGARGKGCASAPRGQGTAARGSSAAAGLNSCPHVSQMQGTLDFSFGA